MQYLIVVTLLLLAACDGSSTPVAKIAVPQREALDKAKGVEQTIQSNADETRQKIDDAAK
ncbi:MAG: hypothetical protein WA632_06690 [Gallionella sp.]